jgi:type IV pilus assembly protein PilC
MPIYRYRAVNTEGKVRSGDLHAANALEIEHRLDNLEYTLISCKELGKSSVRFGRSRLNRKELINFVFQLEQLTKSGVPLLEGLQDLRDSTDAGYYRDVLASLVESIEGGKTFSGALAEFPRDFDTVFVSLVEVGEESGELPAVLKNMGETLRWVDELIATTIKIMMYPAIVGVVLFGVTTFLMIYLVPQIIPLVLEMGGEIPAHTRALIATSDVFVNYWWALIGVPIGLYITIRSMARNQPEIRYKLDQLQLKLWLFGPIVFRIKLARFASYMALLYASGITVLRALEICRALMDNLVLERAIDQIGSRISEGNSISDSFAETGLFPPLVVRMVRVGENTGNLDEALNNVNYFYNREVQDAIDRIEPTINPVMTILMGGVLAWVMMAVLGPLWDTVSKVT